MKINNDRYPRPWSADQLLGLVRAANGNLVCRCVAFDEAIGVMPVIGDHALRIAQAVNAGDDSLTVLQGDVVAWANATFPARQPAMAFMKLFEELGEVIRDPSDQLEWADIFIVLLDLASMYGVNDISAAVRRKMDINRTRKWEISATGVMKRKA